MTKTRPWSYTAGRHGNKVRVYERPNGVIYVAVWDVVVGGQGREVRRNMRPELRKRGLPARVWRELPNVCRRLWVRCM